MEIALRHRPHVAVLDEELPFPLNSGKRIRTFHLLSRLARRQRITFLCHCHADPDETKQGKTAFADLGIRTIVIDRPVPAKSGVGFYARLAANLFSSLPFSVATHRSDELLAAATQLVTDDPPDLWHCEWAPYAEYMRRPLGRAPWVVMAHNVESLIWQRYVETETHPLKRWYIRHQFRKFERFERWAYSSCDAAIAVSAEDAHLIRERFGAQRVEVVDNGVDTAFFTPKNEPSHDRFRILFLGSLDWRPNLDAVRMLLDEILPAVQASEPRATLQIVGRKPAAWLRQKCLGRAGVEIHADVPDVRPYLNSAGILAVPLRIGGGSRLKIVEALAAGLPVITSRIGVEGLHLDAGEHVTVADRPEEMAASLLKMMTDFPSSLRQAERGRQRVLEQYDWSELAERLETVWMQFAGKNISAQNQLATCLV